MQFKSNLKTSDVFSHSVFSSAHSLLSLKSNLLTFYLQDFNIGSSSLIAKSATPLITSSRSINIENNYFLDNNSCNTGNYLNYFFESFYNPKLESANHQAFYLNSFSFFNGSRSFFNNNDSNLLVNYLSTKNTYSFHNFLALPPISVDSVTLSTKFISLFDFKR